MPRHWLSRSHAVGRRASRFGRRARAVASGWRGTSPGVARLPGHEADHGVRRRDELRSSAGTDRSMFACMKLSITSGITKHETSNLPHGRRRRRRGRDGSRSRLAIMTKRRFGPNVFIARAGSYADDLEPMIRRRAAASWGWARRASRASRCCSSPTSSSRAARPLRSTRIPALSAPRPRSSAAGRPARSFVAEGQGHCRDSLLRPRAVGAGTGRSPSRSSNSSTSTTTTSYSSPTGSGFTSLAEAGASRLTLRRADLIVSMPKMKTHHWAGVTLSMKNLFGVMPGVYYGWPKNVLHHAGIPESILDINAAVRPHLAIVDGIIGMEGDGPIMGTATARRRARHGHEPARRRRHLRAADGHRSLENPYLASRIRPPGPDRRAAHRPARRESLASLIQHVPAPGRPQHGSVRAARGTEG